MPIYQFECDCCGEKGPKVDNIRIGCLEIKHAPDCDAEKGVPWHPKCIYDSRFPKKS